MSDKNEQLMPQSQEKPTFLVEAQRRKLENQASLSDRLEMIEFYKKDQIAVVDKSADSAKEKIGQDAEGEIARKAIADVQAKTAQEIFQAALESEKELVALFLNNQETAQSNSESAKIDRLLERKSIIEKELKIDPSINSNTKAYINNEKELREINEKLETNPTRRAINSNVGMEEARKKFADTKKMIEDSEKRQEEKEAEKIEKAKKFYADRGFAEAEAVNEQPESEGLVAENTAVEAGLEEVSDANVISSEILESNQQFTEAQEEDPELTVASFEEADMKTSEKIKNKEYLEEIGKSSSASTEEMAKMQTEHLTELPDNKIKVFVAKTWKSFKNIFKPENPEKASRPDQRSLLKNQTEKGKKNRPETIIHTIGEKGKFKDIDRALRKIVIDNVEITNNVFTAVDAARVEAAQANLRNLLDRKSPLNLKDEDMLEFFSFNENTGELIINDEDKFKSVIDSLIKEANKQINDNSDAMADVNNIPVKEWQELIDEKKGVKGAVDVEDFTNNKKATEAEDRRRQKIEAKKNGLHDKMAEAEAVINKPGLVPSGKELPSYTDPDSGKIFTPEEFVDGDGNIFKTDVDGELITATEWNDRYVDGPRRAKVEKLRQQYGVEAVLDEIDPEGYEVLNKLPEIRDLELVELNDGRLAVHFNANNQLAVLTENPEVLAVYDNSGKLIHFYNEKSLFPSTKAAVDELKKYIEKNN